MTPWRKWVKWPEVKWVKADWTEAELRGFFLAFIDLGICAAVGCIIAALVVRYWL